MFVSLPRWPCLQGRGGRARWFVFVPPNLDGFMTVHEIVSHELDWLRTRFIFVPPNLLGVSNLFAALIVLHCVVLCCVVLRRVAWCFLSCCVVLYCITVSYIMLMLYDITSPSLSLAYLISSPRGQTTITYSQSTTLYYTILYDAILTL